MMSQLPPAETSGQAFIKLALEEKVLRFESFTTVTGRKRPYFFSTDMFSSGVPFAAFVNYYVNELLAVKPDFEGLFGLAYKAIPLVCSVAIGLSRRRRDRSFTYNRKGMQDARGKNILVGASLKGRIFVLDDTIGAGKSMREAIGIIRENNAIFAGALVSFDREERSQTGLSTIQELRQEYGVPVLALATLTDLLGYLQIIREAGYYKGINDVIAGMETYRAKYGIRGAV